MSQRAFLSLSLLVVLFQISVALYSFPAYRLVQYDRQGEHFGSAKVAFNLEGALASQKTVSGSLALVLAENAESSQEIIDLVSSGSANAVLILLPQDASDVDQHRWKAVEEGLAKSFFKVPVYFAKRSVELDNLLAEISSDGGISASALSFLSGEALRFDLISKDAVPIKDGELLTLEGHLNGVKREDNPEEAVPTIVLSTSLDSFSAAPLLSHAASSASGVASLLELARVFNSLFSGAKTLPHVNLVFLIENAGQHSYLGTKQWLDKADAKLIDQIIAAVSLDRLEGDSIHLHVSRSEKEPNAKKLYDTFESVAKRLDIPFTITHKKINMSDTHVPWQHEQFAKQKVLGATISSVPTAPEHFGGSNLFDTAVDSSKVSKNVKFVAEALASYIYGINDVDVFKGELAVSDIYLDSMIKSLAKFPRATPFLSQNKEASPIVDGVEKELSRFAKDVKRKSSPFPSDEYVFFNRTEGVVSAYRAKTVIFDFLESLLVAAYLFGVGSYFFGVKDAMNFVLSYLKRGSTKKR